MFRRTNAILIEAARQGNRLDNSHTKAVSDLTGRETEEPVRPSVRPLDGLASSIGSHPSGVNQLVVQMPL